MNLKIITTGDGSQSLFREDLNETYHSTHGAEAESRYVYLEMGLKLFLERKAAPVRILEVGFGTGLNALLTIEYCLKNNIEVDYHTLEPFPLSEEIFHQLAYFETIAFKNSKEQFLKMHRAGDGERLKLEEQFVFTQYFKKLEDFQSVQPFDLIYFDAFAPSKQADMWTVEQMNQLYSLTAKDGVLTTYCAQGQFKRNLKAAGYTMEELPGPPNKKEMTRGRK